MGRAARRLVLDYVNSHLTAPEVEYIVDDCEARVFVSSKRLGEVAARDDARRHATRRDRSWSTV